MEKLIFKYQSISNWIERADKKAQILLGFQIFIVGFILNKNFSIFHCYLFIFIFIVFLILSCMSLYFLYKVIQPRLSNEVNQSLIYYKDIAINSELKNEKIKELLVSESDKDFLSDISNQIIILSKICNEKHEYLKNAESFMISSFMIGILLYFFI